MSSFRTQWPSEDQIYLENILENTLRNRVDLLVPFWCALASIGLLLVQAVTTRRRDYGVAENKTLVARNGGPIVFSFQLARILGCTALVALSVPGLMSHIRMAGPRAEWDANEYILLTNVYTLILAVCATLGSRAWDARLIRHNIAVLLSELAVYTYRDLWPLATYTKRPLDQGEGWIIWAKIGTLVFTAVLIPLFIPSVYTPIDPENPEKVPHPEQTASFLSFHTCGYLTPTVMLGYRVAHLSPSELPSLPDYDRAEVLSQRAAPYLDPALVKKGQHIFFGLLKTFGLQYFSALISMTIHTITQFVAPIAVNQLLKALEPSGTGKQEVRPWFWISLMLISPLVGSMASQRYHFTMTRALADSESLLTQLVFDYSLKVRVKAEAPERQGATAKAKSSSFIGKLNNLVTIDLRNIGGGRDLVILFWVTPVQLIGCTIFLYFLLGWSTFVGIGLMVATLPIPGWLTKVASGVQKDKMKRTDERTQTVTESMNVLRMIKMFGWERKIQSRIDERREEELKYVWKGKVLEAAIELLTFAIPTFTMLATYATATLVMKMELTSAKVFSSMIVFGNLREHMIHTNVYISYFIRGKVSLDRLNNFFKETDLLDAFDEAASLPTATSSEDGPIGFRNARFSWTPSDKPLQVQSGSDEPLTEFKLNIPGELLFRKGKINLIVGATGSGKTSLLMALLGEMHFEETHPDSSFTLPRAGGVSFCVQESWVHNETVRNNILFGLPYDEERYQKVLYQCALERDLELFEAGDQTEVGERGLTLSGGQKARLTLARAIYAQSDVILLDDVLAALDVHTASWIVKKCLQGDLVKGRTVLLVSHNVALCNPIADFIVSVSPEGIVTGAGNDISAILASNPELEAEFEHDEEVIKASQQEADPSTEKEPVRKGSGKLIVAEEIRMGAVGWKPIKFFFNALGGDHVKLFFVIWLGASAVEKMMHSANLWFLGYWSSQYDKYPVAEIPVLRFTGIYTLLLLVTLAIYFARDIYYLLAQIRASRTIHRVLSQSILGTTLRWLDETPVSRIIQRLTADIDAVDGVLTRMLEGLQRTVSTMVVDLASAVLFVPMFTLPGLLIAGLGMYIGSIYMKAQMSVRREMSNAKAPMLSHFGAAASGLVSLRAYGAQSSYRSELRKRLDQYVRLSRMNYDLNRWISFRIDFLGALFTASLAAYLTYFSSISAANVGFSLNRAVEFCSYILWLVRIYNQFQVQSNNLERIVAYTEIEQEPKPTDQGKPPAAWPTSGAIQVDNLVARYSRSSPEILHGLSFDLRAGERVGVVGRTGSGKSSLTLALLRCILTDGAVYFDGVKTEDINLDALRSAITIIPQIPELLSGTLRYNLDPFGEYDDATLNAALRASGLYSSSQSESGESRFTLDSSIASGGSNVSVGQRQIIALARAIIRSSKLLILDEATSAIDHETDSIIQNTLRRELGPDVTVLTVAHRLQTIIDADRILVMDAGKIVEFASPAELLSKPTSIFKTMVDESGDREALYEVATRKA